MGDVCATCATYEVTGINNVTSSVQTTSIMAPAMPNHDGIHLRWPTIQISQKLSFSTPNKFEKVSFYS